jgi:membrane protein implicated in regulation of membrane protease activity
MDLAIVWAVIGLVLVIVELLTGTFFLLMLGIAAFGAAVAAWLGFEFPVQAIVAAVLGGAGCYGVHLYRTNNRALQMPPIDAGMPASFESWLDPAARLARVRYRGATWDARVEGIEPQGVDGMAPGATVYVLAADGNTLRVAKNPPV